MRAFARLTMIALASLPPLGSAAWATTNPHTNPGFETGDFTGWVVADPALADIVTEWVTENGGIYSPCGAYMAVLWGGAGDWPSTLEQRMDLLAGDVLEGWAAFDAADYLPYNDYAYVSVLNGANEVLWEKSVSDVGDLGDSIPEAWSWTAPAAGTYTLKYGVVNSGDRINPSYGLFDVGGLNYEPTPEPATCGLLLFSGGAFLLRKRVRARR